MRRFFALNAADQLRAFTAMRDFLGAHAPAVNGVDGEIVGRQESLVVLQKAATHLGLTDRVPTTVEFDRVSQELKLGWTSARVIRVWGRWRFACDALQGGFVRLTAAQQGLRARHAGHDRNHEDHLTSVRRWLATTPAKERVKDYANWMREENAASSEEEPLLPGAAAIRTALAIAWPDVLRVARGEATLEEAEKLSTSPRKDWTTGPHDLIGRRTVAEIFGVGVSNCEYISKQQGFPKPVAIFLGRRAWLRTDIELYRDTGTAPPRVENELRSLYYDSREIAALFGLRRADHSTKHRLIAPVTGCVGGRAYWLKADVDRWAIENREELARWFGKRGITRDLTTGDPVKKRL